MQPWRRFIALGLIIFFAAASAHGGVYSTIEPKWTLSGDYFRKFQEESLTPLKQFATPEAIQPWQKYYELAATGMLVAKDPPPRGQKDLLSVEQRLNLAVCLLRVREPQKEMPEKAILLLRNALTVDPDNFLLSSTLGTAYQIKGNYADALGSLNDAWRQGWGRAFLAAKKDPWEVIRSPGEWQSWCAKSFQSLPVERQRAVKKSFDWSEKDFAWYAKCEFYQRHLVRLRQKELKKEPLTFAKALEHVDQLFDPDSAPDANKLRFVGESGKFEPGKIAAAEKAKLPSDAIEVVEQLLIWTPDDLRLFWLLGELFNANGEVDVPSARIVFMECLGKFAQMQAQNFATIDPKTGQPDIKPLAFRDEFAKKHPAVGERLIALLTFVPQPIKLAAPAPESGSGSPSNDAKSDDAAVAPFDLNWQPLAVGLGVGGFAGFLVAWRLRDILRRRRSRMPVAGMQLSPESGPSEKR